MTEARFSLKNARDIGPGHGACPGASPWPGPCREKEWFPPVPCPMHPYSAIDSPAGRLLCQGLAHSAIPSKEVSENMFDWNLFLNIIIAILQAIIHVLPAA